MRRPHLSDPYDQLHDDLIGAGFVYAGVDGRGHHTYRRDGSQPVTLPSSGGTYGRAFLNVRASVRRAIRNAG